ncbi:hypothetical protein ABZT27_34765 [Streptomyces sp. NPDC005389]|uniref:hypothetical protein n=1 Tax=Streptomyces sp. NPDC005389 TaxID=3157040 RepID=UPI0033B5969F
MAARTAGRPAMWAECGTHPRPAAEALDAEGRHDTWEPVRALRDDGTTVLLTRTTDRCRGVRIRGCRGRTV